MTEQPEIAEPDVATLCGEPKRGAPDQRCTRPAEHAGRHHYAAPDMKELRTVVTIHQGLPIAMFLAIVEAVNSTLNDLTGPNEIASDPVIENGREGAVIKVAF
jgi:hypothetical protein